MMPGMDGFEVCRRLKADPATRDIPVIFVTAMSEVVDETLGFTLGAVDYITKPISPPIVEARVKAHLENKHARDFIEDRNRVLQVMVLERTRELAATQDATILSMATLAETRDPETGHHLQRTQGYVRSLAVRLGAHVKYRDQLDDRVIDLLYKSAPLHDIGKVGVPDSILRKPGPLDAEEWKVMKAHTTIGGRILSGSRSPLVRMAEEIALTHHERWDGSGYPNGLAGEDIPLTGRICAVCDVFDALISDRPYKNAWPVDAALDEMRQMAGWHLDPNLTRLFLELAPQLLDELGLERFEVPVLA
jgi:putative two-component system response regulator